MDGDGKESVMGSPRDHETQLLPVHEDEIDLKELFRLLWAGKWLIGGTALVAAVASVIVALLLPNIYRAEAVLAPNRDDDAGSLSALAARFGGLANLAGSLPRQSTDKTALGLEILQSRKFITEFIERRELLLPLMAVSGWDRASGELEIDASIYDVAAKQWVREGGIHGRRVPSLQEAYTRFIGSLSVSQDVETGFVTIAVEHYSPIVAQQWVGWLVEDINATMVAQDVGQAEQSIAYLNEQIEATSLAQMHNVFFGLIGEQIKAIMLAKIADEYLFTTLDPAVVPERKLKPRRSLIVLSSTMIGTFVGLFFVWLAARLAD